MIEICDGYFFEKDKKVTNFTLVSKAKRNKIDFKTKEQLDEMVETSRTIGYYANIEQLIKAAADDMVNRKADEGSIATIADWLDEYKAAVNRLTDAINNK